MKQLQHLVLVLKRIWLFADGSLTRLENDLLAPDAGGLQVNEGSHLFGPRVLSDEPVTGLTQTRQKQKWSKQKQARVLRLDPALPVGHFLPPR